MYPYHTPPYSPQVPGDNGVDRRSSYNYPLPDILAQGQGGLSPYINGNQIGNNSNNGSINNSSAGASGSSGHYTTQYPNGSQRFNQEDRFSHNQPDPGHHYNFGRQQDQPHPQHPIISSLSSRESSVGSGQAEYQRNRQRSIAFQEDMLAAVKRKRSSLSDEHGYIQHPGQAQHQQHPDQGTSRGTTANGNLPFHPAPHHHNHNYALDPPTSSSSRRGSGHATSTSDDDAPGPGGPHSPTASSSSLTKKPRLIKACEPCRLRKIGCDGTHPVCQRCKADNRVGECRFIRTIVRSSLTRKRMTELEDRLDRWERLWAGLTGEPREGEGEVDPDGIERSVRDRGERGRELRMRIVEGLGGSVGVKRERQTSGNGNGNGMVLPPQGGSGMNNPNSSGNGNGNGMNMHNQQYSNNLMLDPPVPIPNFLHPNNISLPTPLSSTTTLPLNVSLPVTAPSTAPPSPRTAEWAQSPQIDKNLDGTGSFTRSGGSGSSYLGLSSGVTFLNAILKLCKERGGIFIDVENTLPGDAQASGPPGKVGMGTAKGSEGADLGLGLGLGLGLDVKQLDTADRKPGSPRATSPVEGDLGLSNAEIVVRARTLPPKEEYMPFVDSYFMYFHGITPMVHEPTVRATLTGRIPFPDNDSYLALIYMIFAMGALDSVSQESDFHGQKYCDIARAILNNDIMESGSVELVQAIAILANYLQRNDKPNAGYLCLGAAVRMAIGIGLHVHDNNIKMSPLEAEMRKRVWWSISVLESGCSKTFGRPSGLCGVNLSQIPLPSNIDDEHLTSASERLPPGVARETLYSTLIAHSKLARATTIVHTSILQLQPAPSLEQIRQYDRMILQVIGELPSYITYPTGPVRYGFPRYVLLWRLRDWRAILYRPILLAAAWDQVKEKHLNPAIVDAISICRSLAAENLSEMADYIRAAQLRGATRAEEWYCMYFAHQSSLTLLLSLVGEPAHIEAENWRQTILATATWFRQLQAMKTAGTALASILENVVFATASIPIREQTSITPTDNWLLNPNAGNQNGQAVLPNDALDVMRYWNALCPDGVAGPVWDDSIWNAMFSMNPDPLG